MNRRQLLKSTRGMTAATVIPITVAAVTKEVSADELLKEIDSTIERWLVLSEKTGLGRKVMKNVRDPNKALLFTRVVENEPNSEHT